MGVQAERQRKREPFPAARFQGILRPMKWSPKDWPWPPPLAKAFGWLRRSVAGTPAIARKALLNADRQDVRRLWARAKSYAAAITSRRWC